MKLRDENSVGDAALAFAATAGENDVPSGVDRRWSFIRIIIFRFGSGQAKWEPRSSVERDPVAFGIGDHHHSITQSPVITICDIVIRDVCCSYFPASLLLKSIYTEPSRANGMYMYGRVTSVSRFYTLYGQPVKICLCNV